MSRTYKLIGYKKGQPVQSTHLNKEVPYRYYQREVAVVRKKWNRCKRHKLKMCLKKFGEIPIISNTNGWLSH